MIVGKRVAMTPDDDTRAKLIRLAIACQKHPTTLATDLARLCLNTPNIIDFVQKENEADERFRVKYRIEDGKLVYD